MKKTFALLLALIFCFSMTGCATIATLAFNTAVQQTVTEEELLVSEEEPYSKSIEESITDFADDILEEYLDGYFGEGAGEMITCYLEETYGKDFEAELKHRLEEAYGENYDEVIREYLEEHFGENFEQDLKEYIVGSIGDHSAEEPIESSEPTTGFAAEPTVEDLVTTAYETHLQGTDSIGNEYDCTYRIPAFTFDTPEAQDVNTYLMNWLLPYIEEQQANHQAGVSILVSELDYDAWIYDGILTVLIFVNTDWSQSYYQVYSIDIYTGEFLDNTDILAKLGFTEDMYHDVLYSVIESMYDTTAAEIAGLEFLEQQLESTLSEENLRAATLFFDENGNLKLHITVYPLAGPSTYETIIDLPIG